MSFSTRHFVGSTGNKLVADVAGEAADPAVLLLHGGGQTRHSWGRCARDLVRHGYYVVALDARGHGDSDWAPEGDYSLDAFVADLKTVMATLPSPIALVGASLGGLTSLVALGEDPGMQVSALVLVDIVPHAERSGIDRVRQFMMANAGGFADLDEVADAVARYLPHRRRPIQNEGLMKNLRRGENGRLYWHWDPRFNEIDDVDAELARNHRRMAEAARRIVVPTLIVRGGLSDVVTADGLEQTRALMPQATFVEVSDAAHMVAGDSNDRFSSVVLGFLDSLKSGATLDKGKHAT